MASTRKALPNFDIVTYLAFLPYGCLLTNNQAARPPSTGGSDCSKTDADEPALAIAVSADSDSRAASMLRSSSDSLWEKSSLSRRLALADTSEGVERGRGGKSDRLKEARVIVRRKEAQISARRLLPTCCHSQIRTSFRRLTYSYSMPCGHKTPSPLRRIADRKVRHFNLQNSSDLRIRSIWPKFCVRRTPMAFPNSNLPSILHQEALNGVKFAFKYRCRRCEVTRPDDITGDGNPWMRSAPAILYPVNGLTMGASSLSPPTYLCPQIWAWVITASRVRTFKIVSRLVTNMSSLSRSARRHALRYFTPHIRRTLSRTYYEGKVEKINGVETYVAIPEGEYDKTKAVCESYFNMLWRPRLSWCCYSIPHRYIRHAIRQ